MIKKNNLGVVIITKNEEKNIGRCLKSIQWADEIIIIDCYSNDKTIEIAKQYKKVKVIRKKWPGDGPQKYFGISQLKTNWCLSIDADEEVTLELRKSIEKTLNNPLHSFYAMHRKSFFLGKIINHGDWGKDWVIRLFNCKKHQWTKDIVHAKLNVEKKYSGFLQGKLMHYSQESIFQSLKKMNNYSNSSSIILDKKNKKTSLIKANIHKHWTFIRGFFLKAGFLDGKKGYIIAKLSAYGSFFKYIKLWEKNNES